MSEVKRSEHYALEFKHRSATTWMEVVACAGSGGREAVEEWRDAMHPAIKNLFRIVKVTEIREPK